ncbi:hypothetical protein PIB30_091061 [Stylosanthes scabra]|uniref:Uncharacterized protein n=1 Tax=Stylosanthes scabra TaxID=79078 RepID=A0ABU6ZTT7_9FABA|nr:hypothetical protein [Stylosanthes scabra]
MEHKKNQATFKGKEKVMVPPTRVSPRLAALRAPQSQPLKIRTPPSRASPRLAALKDSPLLPSPTSVIMPEKLLVLALAAPMTTPPLVATVSRNPIALTSETPQPRKIRRTARMSVKPIRRSDSEINKNVEDDVKEHNAMDELLIPEEEEVPEVEQRFWDYDDLDDWGTAEPADSSKASCTEHPPPNP